jgi:hypothetical protein
VDEVTEAPTYADLDEKNTFAQRWLRTHFLAPHQPKRCSWQPVCITAISVTAYCLVVSYTSVTGTGRDILFPEDAPSTAAAWMSML